MGYTMSKATRVENIKKIIEKRKERNEIHTCKFYITVHGIIEPLITPIRKNKRFKPIIDILDKNHIEYGCCDSFPGYWSLNHYWIETDDIECTIEYGGVYPVNWNIEDVVTLEDLYYEGKFIIMVDVYEDGKYVPIY